LKKAAVGAKDVVVNPTLRAAALAGIGRSFQEFSENPISSSSEFAADTYIMTKALQAGGRGIRKIGTNIDIARGKAKVIDPSGKVTLSSGEVAEFKPVVSESRSASDLLGYQGSKVKAVHVSEGGLTTNKFGEGVFKAPQSKNIGPLRRQVSSTNTFFSSPSKTSGNPQGYLGYLSDVRATNAGPSLSGPKVYLVKPKNYAYFADETVGTLPEGLFNGADDAVTQATKINAYIGNKPGQLFVPGENIAGLSTEGQFVASAEKVAQISSPAATGTKFNVLPSSEKVVYNQPYKFLDDLGIQQPKGQFGKFFTAQQIPIQIKRLQFTGAASETAGKIVESISSPKLPANEFISSRASSPIVVSSEAGKAFSGLLSLSSIFKSKSPSARPFYSGLSSSTSKISSPSMLTSPSEDILSLTSSASPIEPISESPSSIFNDLYVSPIIESSGLSSSTPLSPTISSPLKSENVRSPLVKLPKGSQRYKQFGSSVNEYTVTNKVIDISKDFKNLKLQQARVSQSGSQWQQNLKVKQSNTFSKNFRRPIQQQRQNPAAMMNLNMQRMLNNKRVFSSASKKHKKMKWL